MILRYFYFICIFAFCLSGLPILTKPAIAGPDCLQAKTTAEQQACMKNRLLTVQDSLQKQYEATEKGVADPAIREQLQNAHKEWLSYRDSHCQLQADLTDVSGLAPLSTTHCQIRLTLQRQRELSGLLSDPADLRPLPEDFDMRPRWINALGRYSGYYWEIGQEFETDLDCDGVIEYVIPGLVQSKEDGMEIWHPVLAHVSYPIAGAAEANVFEVNDHGMETEEVCVPPFSFEKIRMPSPKPEAADEQNRENASCQAQIVIKWQGCSPYSLEQNENGLSFEKVPFQDE